MFRKLARLPLRVARRVARVATGGRPVRQTLRELIEEEPREAPAERRAWQSEAAPAPGAPREVEEAPHLHEAPRADEADVAEAQVDEVESDVEPLPVHAEATPNPNAMKFNCPIPVVDQGTLSWGTPTAAAGHPLGEALFDLDGVRLVFAVNDFVTVTKEPEASWFELAPRIEHTIGRVLAAR